MGADDDDDDDANAAINHDDNCAIGARLRGPVLDPGGGR